jgi:hypothetical protein
MLSATRHDLPTIHAGAGLAGAMGGRPRDSLAAVALVGAVVGDPDLVRNDEETASRPVSWSTCGP